MQTPASDHDTDSFITRRFLAGALALSPVALSACASSSPHRLSRGDAKYALEVLDRAPEHGFAPGSFNVTAIRAARDAKDPKADVLLREAVVDYARAQHGLLIPSRARPAAWGMKPKKYDAAAEMEATLTGGNFREWLDALPPADPLYRTLQQAYAQSLKDGAAGSPVLRANLERLRWMPREEHATRVDVNIASATLLYLVNGQPKLTMRTASGKPGDETPMLTSAIDHVVLNPPWNVPDGIAQDELLPKGGDYLAANGYVTKDDGRLMQLPGADSALGLVKFDFDNPYAVYLHDTPSKAAFNRQTRAVSHGCVRLERAIDLANLILGEQPGWSPDRIGEVIAQGETKTVALQNSVPVRLMYLTAVPDQAGITPVPDVYGWDPQVVRLLDRFGAESAAKKA